jgi:hypothetical protein
MFIFVNISQGGGRAKMILLLYSKRTYALSKKLEKSNRGNYATNCMFVGQGFLSKIDSHPPDMVRYMKAKCSVWRGTNFAPAVKVKPVLQATYCTVCGTVNTYSPTRPYIVP